MANNSVEIFVVAVMICIAYWLPTINACYRNRKQQGAIAILNFLTGWTGIGWIIAMVWSAKED